LNKREDVLFRLYAHFISPSQRQALQIALATAIRLLAQRLALELQADRREACRLKAQVGLLSTMSVSRTSHAFAQKEI